MTIPRSWIKGTIPVPGSNCSLELPPGTQLEGVGLVVSPLNPTWDAQAPRAVRGAGVGERCKGDAGVSQALSRKPESWRGGGEGMPRVRRIRRGGGGLRGSPVIPPCRDFPKEETSPCCFQELAGSAAPRWSRWICLHCSFSESNPSSLYHQRKRGRIKRSRKLRKARGSGGVRRSNAEFPLCPSL